MSRMQELTTVYVPIKNDPVDQLMAHFVNTYHPPVPFFRLSPQIYLFGSRKVLVKQHDKDGRLVFRVGGGFCSFEEFVETYAAEELEKLEQLDHSNSALATTSGIPLISSEASLASVSQLAQLTASSPAGLAAPRVRPSSGGKRSSTG